MLKLLFLLPMILSNYVMGGNDGFSEDLFDEIPFDAGKEKNLKNISGIYSLQDKIEEFNGAKKSQNYLSIATGTESLGEFIYFTLFPKFNWYDENFEIKLGLPIRFRVYDYAKNYDAKYERKYGFVDGKTFINPRPQDFVSIFDAQKIIRNFSVGKKYSDFYLSLDRNEALSLSQGSLAKNIIPNWFYDEDYLFAKSHASFEHFRLEGFLGPLVKAKILGVNAKLSPFSSLKINNFIKNTNVDVTYVADFDAPNYASKVSLTNGDEVFKLDDEHRLVKRKTGTVQGQSLTFSSGIMPDYWVFLKPYLSLSQLFFTGLNSNTDDKSFYYGAGAHLGSEITFYVSAKDPESIIYLNLEARALSPNYWPSYFNSTYMLDRTSLNQLASIGPNDANTKSLMIKNGNFDSFGLGYLASLGYSYNNALYSTMSFEDAYMPKEKNNIPFMRKLSFAFGANVVERIHLNLNYEYYGLNKISKTFDFYDYRKLLSLKCRTQILPYLYADIWSGHKFGVIDMYTKEKGKTYFDGFDWLSHDGEVLSFDYGLGLDFAMNF